MWLDIDGGTISVSKVRRGWDGRIYWMYMGAVMGFGDGLSPQNSASILTTRMKPSFVCLPNDDETPRITCRTINCTLEDPLVEVQVYFWRDL
jgi:hypothetical protein